MVLLPKVPYTFVEPVAVAPPVIPVPVGNASQVYVVPVGITPLVTSVGVMLNDTPLQLVCVNAFTLALGLMIDQARGISRSFAIGRER